MPFKQYLYYRNSTKCVTIFIRRFWRYSEDNWRKGGKKTKITDSRDMNPSPNLCKSELDSSKLRMHISSWWCKRCFCKRIRDDSSLVWRANANTNVGEDDVREKLASLLISWSGKNFVCLSLWRSMNNCTRTTILHRSIFAKCPSVYVLRT